MALYLIVWHADLANLPTDSNEVLAVWAAAAAGAEAMLASGGFREIRWTNKIEGYCLAECESKAEALALRTPFLRLPFTGN